MGLLKSFDRFQSDEAGAVTVDWVVLTAAIVGLGLVVVSPLGGSAYSFGGAVGTGLANKTMSDLTFSAD